MIKEAGSFQLLRVQDPTRSDSSRGRLIDIKFIYLVLFQRRFFSKRNLFIYVCVKRVHEAVLNFFFF